MKKKTALLLIIAALLLLCGCFHEHSWAEATCTEPKTCTSCGETEGEALGHTWKAATCTEPKTCTVCGATEGEALGHQWTEATYLTPKTCSVCGETEGGPKPSMFEQYGFPVSDTLKNFETTAIFALDRENNPQKIQIVNAAVSFKTFTVLPSEKRDGYKTIKVIYDLMIPEPSSYKTGSFWFGDLYDYYTGYMFSVRGTFEDETVELFDSVEIDGAQYTIYYSYSTEIGKKERIDNVLKRRITVTHYIDIPEGYDGLVLRFIDHEEWDDSDNEIESGQLLEADGPGHNFFIGRN